MIQPNCTNLLDVQFNENVGNLYLKIRRPLHKIAVMNVMKFSSSALQFSMQTFLQVLYCTIKNGPAFPTKKRAPKLRTTNSTKAISAFFLQLIAIFVRHKAQSTSAVWWSVQMVLKLYKYVDIVDHYYSPLNKGCLIAHLLSFLFGCKEELPQLRVFW